MPPRTFRFTHPFHPLRGRQFEIVDHRASWGDDWIYFHDDDGRLISVRASWTDAVDPDPFVVAAQGRALLHVDDLVRLAALMAGLGSPRNV